MSYKLAVIPWSASGLQNRMFITDDERMNVDHRNNPYYEMKKEFEKRGDFIQTVDLYQDLTEVDYFLFLELDWNWLLKVIEAGGESRMIYCNAEPPVVNPLNCPKGYRFLSNFFPYILTYNEDWVDDETIFKRNIPYFFEENIGNIGFDDRKLLTSISGNKKSKHPDELYSERERVITFFENNYPEEFEFYGTGWDGAVHPGYRGRVDKKAETYHFYKFAICFENMKNIKGYVTEKILDCLTSGIVPIYAGAEDIEEYVPKDCFIDYWQFNDCNAMAEYLLNVNESTYQAYLDAAKRFLHTDHQEKFSGKEYARNIYVILNQHKEFKVSGAYVLYIKILLWKRTYVAKIRKILRGNKKKAK